MGECLLVAAALVLATVCETLDVTCKYVREKITANILLVRRSSAGISGNGTNKQDKAR